MNSKKVVTTEEEQKESGSPSDSHGDVVPLVGDDSNSSSHSAFEESGSKKERGLTFFLCRGCGILTVFVGISNFIFIVLVL